MMSRWQVLALLGMAPLLTCAMSPAERAPPQTRAEYAHGYPAMLACLAAFEGGVLPDRIADDIFQSAQLQQMGIAPDARRDSLVKIDPTLRIATVETPKYAAGARDFPGYGCALLPPGRDRPYGPPLTARPAIDWAQTDVPAQPDDERFAQADHLLFADDPSTEALLVMRDGRLIHERYKPGRTRAVPIHGFSCTKSLIAMLIGALVEDGTLTLDQPVPIPEWQTTGDPRRAITIRALLQMSGGLSPKAEDVAWRRGAAFSTTEFIHHGFVDTDRYVAYAAYGTPPGTTGAYQDLNFQLLTRVAEEVAKARGTTLRDLLARKLFRPLGIRDAAFMMDMFGNVQGYVGAYLRPMDWLKLGQLMLQDGLWNGRRLLSADFVAAARTRAPAWRGGDEPLRQERESGVSYSAGFWVIVGSSRDTPQFGAAPPDTFGMWGNGGQSVIVIPSLHTVIVRMGYAPATMDRLVRDPTSGAVGSAMVGILPHAYSAVIATLAKDKP